MTINKKADGVTLILELEGRLDTTTAPRLEAVISDDISACKELVFDLEKLEYLSSAGLRVLLSAQKRMANQGAMRIRNANESILEIFDITGFSDILTIE